jgi:hypothetical protein
VSSPMKMRNGKVITAPATTTYAQWAALEMPGLPEADRAALEDADRDGLSNLVECATGLPPLAPTLSPMTLQPGANGMLRLRHTRLANGSDFALGMESASSADWLAPAAPPSLRSVTMLSDGRELLEWHAPAPAPPETRLFRLRATVAP